MDPRKILVLGIGNAQADLLKWCKEQGLEVHACSYTKMGRGMRDVDHFALIDIKDTGKILHYVNDHEIDFIYSIGSDIAMPTIARVAGDSDLFSFINFNTANICQNKVRLREALGTDFKYNIPFRRATDVAGFSSWDIYPAIIKPVDSQGQRGIYEVDSFEAVQRHFDKSSSFSSNGEVIIEKYLSGDEISINAYVFDNGVKFFYVSDRVSYSEYPGGIIKEHLYPSKYAHLEKDLKVLVAETVHKLDISNGPVYFQICIVNEVPYIIEVTPRFDGCHMWRLIKMTKGIDLLEIAMTHLLTGKINPSFFLTSESSTNSIYRLKFLAQPPQSKIKYPADLLASGQLYCEYYYEEGDVVPEMNGYIEKTGYYIDRIEP